MIEATAVVTEKALALALPVPPRSPARSGLADPALDDDAQGVCETERSGLSEAEDVTLARSEAEAEKDPPRGSEPEGKAVSVCSADSEALRSADCVAAAGVAVGGAVAETAISGEPERIVVGDVSWLSVPSAGEGVSAVVAVPGAKVGEAAPPGERVVESEGAVLPVGAAQREELGVEVRKAAVPVPSSRVDEAVPCSEVLPLVEPLIEGVAKVLGDPPEAVAFAPLAVNCKGVAVGARREGEASAVAVSTEGVASAEGSAEVVTANDVLPPPTPPPLVELMLALLLSVPRAALTESESAALNVAPLPEASVENVGVGRALPQALLLAALEPLSPLEVKVPLTDAKPPVPLWETDAVRLAKGEGVDEAEKLALGDADAQSVDSALTAAERDSEGEAVALRLEAAQDVGSAVGVARAV